MNQGVDFDPLGALECMEVLRPHHTSTGGHFGYLAMTENLG